VNFELHDPNNENKHEVLQILKVNTLSKIILSTSRLVTHYGVDRLVKASVKLFKNTENAVCILAGTGPDEVSLKKAVADNDMVSRILFLGMVERNMVKKLLNAADIYVLLARLHNCTNSMWEAMVCGKCIVTMENEAIKKVLTSGQDAILLKPTEIDKLPDLLERLLKDDAERQRLGNNARTRAQNILRSWPDRIKEEVDLLEAMVSHEYA
jgi:glycosyltransferase involved in cell wall biosynthesis